MTISVVLFDLDDTIFAHRRAVDEGILAHVRGLDAVPVGIDPVAEMARWHELEEKHYHRYLSGELDYLGQRRARSRAFVEPYGVTLDDRGADAWFDAYLEHYRGAWTLHADTLPCLDALGALRLGVVTNGDPAFQDAKIAALGLADRFEHVIASGALGFTKPDPRIFAHACALFDVAPESAAYVGDRLGTDAIGAAAAGLTGVWLARGSLAAEEDLAAAAASGVLVIGSLAELPALLQ